MLNGHWNVYNKEGKQFKIQVKNGTIPHPSEYEGDYFCEWKDMFWFGQPSMCCPSYVTVEKKSANHLVMKDTLGKAKEIWMRDLQSEKDEMSNKSRFVELEKMEK
jgi:desulfoferrodoxin (superoxide reductase-like protein)